MTLAESCLWYTAAACGALFAITFVPLVLDRRTIDRQSVWAKPLKFDLALALHFATLASASQLLGPAWRGGLPLLAVAVTACLSTAFEVCYINLQAARARHSHFNRGTPAAAAMYFLMALGALLLTTAAGVIGTMVLLDGAAQIRAPLRWSVGIGLIGGTALTLVVAFTMGGRLTHHVGVEPEAAIRAPLFGWSLAVGDFRPAHFAATHMMQAIPAVGLFATAALPPTQGLILVIFAGIAWSVATVLLFRQALAGRPIFVGGPPIASPGS